MGCICTKGPRHLERVVPVSQSVVSGCRASGREAHHFPSLEGEYIHCRPHLYLPLSSLSAPYFWWKLHPRFPVRSGSCSGFPGAPAGRPGAPLAQMPDLTRRQAVPPLRGRASTPPDVLRKDRRQSGWQSLNTSLKGGRFPALADLIRGAHPGTSAVMKRGTGRFTQWGAGGVRRVVQNCS